MGVILREVGAAGCWLVLGLLVGASVAVGGGGVLVGLVVEVGGCGVVVGMPVTVVEGC